MQAEAADYRLRITYRANGDVDHRVEIDDPYRYGRVLTDFDLHLLSEGTHHRAFEKARRASHQRRDDDRRALRRLGAERRSRERHRRLQRLGRAGSPDAAARAVRDLGDLHAGPAGRRAATSSKSARRPARC